MVVGATRKDPVGFTTRRLSPTGPTPVSYTTVWSPLSRIRMRLATFADVDAREIRRRLEPLRTASADRNRLMASGVPNAPSSPHAMVRTIRFATFSIRMVPPFTPLCDAPCAFAGTDLPAANRPRSGPRSE